MARSLRARLAGAQFAPDLNAAGIHHVVRKGTDPAIDSYSGYFDNARRNATGLADYLRGQGVDEVHVMGLAADYCVKFTVLDALDLGFRTTVITDGVRGVNLREGDVRRALDEMRAAGAVITQVHDGPPISAAVVDPRTHRAAGGD